jgi:hypothetical protein
VIKEGQEKFIRSNLSRVSRQRREFKCVCSPGTSSDSTTIKQAVFSKFDLSYLPCCLRPLLHSLWWRGVTRRPGTHVSVPLDKSTSIHLILDSLNGFRGRAFPYRNPIKRSFKDSDQGWDVAKSGRSCDDPNSGLIQRENQEHCSVSPARRLQCATWHHLEKTTVCAEASRLP